MFPKVLRTSPAALCVQGRPAAGKAGDSLLRVVSLGRQTLLQRSCSGVLPASAAAAGFAALLGPAAGLRGQQSCIADSQGHRGRHRCALAAAACSEVRSGANKAVRSITSKIAAFMLDRQCTWSTWRHVSGATASPVPGARYKPWALVHPNNLCLIINKSLHFGRAWLAGLIAAAEATCAADGYCRGSRRASAFGGWRAACAVQRADRRQARSVLAAWDIWCKVSLPMVFVWQFMVSEQA